MVWGLRGEGVVFQGLRGNMGSVRAHSYSSHTTKRWFFQSHTLAAAVVLLWCSSDVPVRAETLSCLGLLVVFINVSGE